jgi:hypothetical protein
VTDDELLARLDPGPFYGDRPDLDVICSRGCLERPCSHTYPVLAALTGWPARTNCSLRS